MNLGASAIVIRPRTTAEGFDLACRLVFTVGRSLSMRLGALVLLPCFAGLLWLRYSAEWTWPWIWVTAAGLAMIAQGVFTVAAGRLLFSESLAARTVLRAFAARLPSYLSGVLVGRVLVGLALLFFPLGLWVWTRLLFQHEAILLEGAGPMGSISRSSRFVKDRDGGVFLILVGLLGAQGCIVVCAEVLSAGIIEGLFQLGKPFGSLFEDGGSPAALLGFLLSIPYVATARFLQYIDMRTRSDGWDIQLRFMAIAAHEAAKEKAA